jgi:hypothetical protein
MALRPLIALLLLSAAAHAADPRLTRQQVRNLNTHAQHAIAAKDLEPARITLEEALRLCRTLPPNEYKCITDVQWHLSRLYLLRNDRPKAEAIALARLDLLTKNQLASGPPDLDIGVALFELQSLYSAPGNAMLERIYANRGLQFYQRCISGYPAYRDACDRNLAAVEALHASSLFVAQKYAEAAPFVLSVVSRPDAGVQKELLIAALRIHITILLSGGKVIDAAPFQQRLLRLETAKP